MQELNSDQPLLVRDGAGQFKLTIGVEKTTELSYFEPLPFTLPGTMINAQGELEFLFSVPDSAAFFRLKSRLLGGRGGDLDRTRK